jgi:uncharacterized protein
VRRRAAERTVRDPPAVSADVAGLSPLARVDLDIEVRQASVLDLTRQIDKQRMRAEEARARFESARTRLGEVQAGQAADGDDLERLRDDVHRYERESTVLAEALYEQARHSRQLERVLVRELAELGARRDAVLDGLSREARLCYDAAVRAGRRPPVVPVNADSCCGCNMRLPAQRANEVRGGRAIFACPHCGRLLYPPSGDGARP